MEVGLDMLQTKKPPEQEKSDAEISTLTKRLKESSSDAAEESHSVMLDKEDGINKSILTAHTEFCEYERSLIAKSKRYGDAGRVWFRSFVWQYGRAILFEQAQGKGC